MRTKTPETLRAQMLRLCEAYGETTDRRIIPAYTAYRRYMRAMRRYFNRTQPYKSFERIGLCTPVPVAYYTTQL